MNEHLSEAFLIDYLHGELAPADDALVLMHLERCDACRAEYQLQTRLGESLKAYGARSERELPGVVRAAVWQAIDAGANTGVERLRAWLRPAMGLGLAAAVAVALALGLPPRTHRSTPEIDAMYFLDDHAAMRASIPFNEGTSGQQWLAASDSSDVTVDALAH